MIGRARTGLLTDRAALAALGLLLAAAVATRLVAREGTVRGKEATGALDADLGDGVLLRRGAAARRQVLLGACLAPVVIDVVEPSPHGRDALLAASPDPDDRVFYAYRGWTLGGPLAAAELVALHVAWRATAVMRMDGTKGLDALAIKVTVPAGCAAGPEDALAALAALRQDASARR